MTVVDLAHVAESSSHRIPGHLSSRLPASYGHDRPEQTGIEAQLRKALARDEDLIPQQRDLIRRQALLSKESDHRFLNGLQMVVSLLSLQSRASSNPEIASQLAVAANRVATIERVHRRLHCLDGRPRCDQAISR
ncbi:histidine kinase dimerization/phosphoacceptor domain -containing protein [Mesorhizobium sp. BAC0120]|uniref:histidine kinase dimerization/phosphoacceptor domain -containing protein n=1 Tax=Mesorhizobium sp. BAC0120 TaxID=3090670 RepID=UPI00399B918E